MKLLIVEDDPSLRSLLAELVQGEIPEAETFVRDNLNDAVDVINYKTIAGILTDGTFPTYPQGLVSAQWNRPKPNWIGLAGWAEKKHIPIVVLTGAGDVADHACRVGVPVFMKPLQVHKAIACLRALVVPKAVRENPVVANQNHKNAA
jgi:CheY-like chemotaxis protein